MATLEEIREARGVVAELAAANPVLQLVFDRLDREYREAKDGQQNRLARAAHRARDLRQLV